MKSLIHTIPPHLLEPVTFARLHGHFADDGRYQTRRESFHASCWVEPIDEPVTVSVTGIRSAPRVYIHSPVELYSGTGFIRDVVFWRDDAFMITSLDSWPTYGYWCALAQKYMPTKQAYPALNDTVRQLMSTLLSIEPRAVRPAYQLAPQSDEPFITIDVWSLTCDKTVATYVPDQETLEGQNVWRAHVLVSPEKSDLAFSLIHLLEGSHAQMAFDSHNIGLVATWPPQRENEMISVRFDFVTTDQWHAPLNPMPPGTCQIIYDKE